MAEVAKQIWEGQRAEGAHKGVIIGKDKEL